MPDRSTLTEELRSASVAAWGLGRASAEVHDSSWIRAVAEKRILIS